MFCALLLTSVIALIVYSIYKWTKNSDRYFEERNLKYTSVSTYIEGLYELLTGKFDFYGSRQKFYNRFPNESIFGALGFFRTYYIRNPEVYKRIAIKDFFHFEDHRVVVDGQVDEMMGNMLISLHGEKWRQMRATLSPAFTGSKMRQMFDLTSECAEDVVKHFLCKVKSGERINAEMKEFATRYTNDVIATCAFGLKINSFSNPDNDFYKNGISLLTYRGLWDVVKSIAKVLIAKITRVFKPKIVDETITNWFKSSILDTMAKRREKNIVRPDMINILMQLREGSLTPQTDDSENEKVAHDEFAVVEESELGKVKVTRKWSENELIAQCFIFFLAGMEVSSWAITFVVYELIVNPDIQQKLYEEIVAVNDGLDGKRITYDLIQKMKFLDQVVSETLRKWPIVLETERMCTKDYVYDDGEKKFTIEKGSSIIYPIYAIQRDPKYFPNPDIFDPTRFSDANKHNILPGSYAPFGIGPRSCIASRFALMEIKVMLYYLLLNFSLEPNENTQIPLKMKRTIAMVTEKGVHLELNPRKV